MSQTSFQREDAKTRRRKESSADFQVCCVAGFQTRKPYGVVRPADFEIGDTAGLETCATILPHCVFAPSRLCVEFEVLQ